MRTARPRASSHTRSSAKRIPNVWIERVHGSSRPHGAPVGRPARPSRRARRVVATRTTSPPTWATGRRARRRGIAGSTRVKGPRGSGFAPAGSESARGLVRRRAAALALESRHELVQPQLLEAPADGLQLARAEVDQLAALLAQVERLAQTGLAGVQPADDLLDPGGGRLVGAGLGVLGHGSSSSMRARTRSSWTRTDTARAARAAAALVSRAPASSSTSA